jgi:hypothetical protein
MPLLGASALGALDLEIDLYTAAILSAFRLCDCCRLSKKKAVVDLVMFYWTSLCDAAGNYPKKKIGRPGFDKNSELAIRESGGVWVGLRHRPNPDGQSSPG